MKFVEIKKKQRIFIVCMQARCANPHLNLGYFLISLSMSYLVQFFLPDLLDGSMGSPIEIEYN